MASNQTHNSFEFIGQTSEIEELRKKIEKLSIRVNEL
jgi:hypothetical protein